MVLLRRAGVFWVVTGVYGVRVYVSVCVQVYVYVKKGIVVYKGALALIQGYRLFEGW